MLKQKLLGVIVGIILIFSYCKITHAQSLSELSVDIFKKISETEEKRAPKSPFSRQGVSTAEDLAIEDLMLTGVVTGQAEPYALISGYLVEVGDKIAGFHVDSIEKGKVALRRLDEVYILSIGGF
ncbi:MAG: hypothetical protein COS89_00660 [Deltaproteobacteria bacterium CG07_land_8_20_14_0_80_38_7]|nr:MAG: hypothetical protein COS89_00660 [Deltaproteobacteria bacterium CG07_land_8_20_14_0_80_38_7]